MTSFGYNTLGFGGGEAGVGIFTANAVQFDSSNDFLTKTSDLTGNSDGKVFTCSFWVNKDPTVPDFIDKVIYEAGSAQRFLVKFDSKLRVRARNSSNTIILELTAQEVLTQNVWSHVLISVDMTNESNSLIYVDDVDISAVWQTFTNENIDFTQTTHTIGARSAADQLLDADLSEFYFKPEHLLLSTESNRRFFIDAASKPAADLTSRTPLIYLSGATDSWHTNKGTGGGFTENGALTTASTSPSD